HGKPSSVGAVLPLDLGLGHDVVDVAQRGDQLAPLGGVDAVQDAVQVVEPGGHDGLHQGVTLVQGLEPDHAPVAGVPLPHDKPRPFHAVHQVGDGAGSQVEPGAQLAHGEIAVVHQVQERVELRGRDLEVAQDLAAALPDDDGHAAQQ